MSVVRRLLRFNLVGFVIGFLLIAAIYAAVMLLIWMAFGDAAPHFN